MNPQIVSIARRAAKDITKGYDIKVRIEMAIKDALVQQSNEQETVAHPFEDKAVISALSWAAGLIEQAYRECGGHNGADSWLMNYADKQGERIRQADHREWEKVNGRWQVKATPPQRKPLTDEKIEAIKILADDYARKCAEFARCLAVNMTTDSMSPVAMDAGDARLKLHQALEAAHNIKD